MRNPYKRTPIAAALLMFAALPSPAAEIESEPSKESAPTELEAVDVNTSTIKNDDYIPGVSTVGAKAPTPVRDILQTVTVIDRAVLDSQHATSLVEALRNVPGITISAGEGGQIGNNINIRGFSARTDIYLDGFRDRGQFSRDTFALDSVEVLEGPSSLLFGRGSTGGVINQVSKRPTLAPVGEITGSVGTDNYYRSTLDVGHRISDDSAFRVEAFGQRVDSTRDVASFKDWGVAPSLRFGIRTDTEVTLSWFSQHNDDIPDYGVPLLRFQGQTIATPIKSRKDNYYGFSDDTFAQDVNVFNLGVTHKFTPDLTLRSQGQYSLYHVAASPTPLGGLVDPVTGAAIASTSIAAGTSLDQLYAIRQQRDRSIRDSSLFNQTDLIYKLKTGPVNHLITTGIEIGRDEYGNDTWNRLNANSATSSNNISPVPPVNLGSPVYIDKPDVEGNVVRLRTQSTQTNADTFAVYLNDQIDLTKELKLIAGVRWDKFDASQDQTTYAYPTPINPATPQRTITQTSLDHADRQYSTRAGIIYQPTAAQSYYLAYGTSFNPSAETLTLTATQANLDPEKNRSFEVGSKWDLFTDRLSLNTSLFRVEKTNARTTDTAGFVTLNGDIRVQGAELKIVGRPLPNWQVLGGYTYLDGKILDSNDFTNIGTTTAPINVLAKGKTPQNTPTHSATLWNTYRPLPYLEFGGGLVYASDRYVNNTETAEVNGYVRFDAAAAFLQKAYDIRLNLQNFTDKHYYETAAQGRATPANGFRAILGVTYRFL